MATQAQVNANRRNSQLSTGPRSQAGKTASSRNSTRTGLYAKSLLIDGEDPEELAALQQDYFDSCDPQGPLETALVLELLRSEWLLRRMATVETHMWNISAPYARDADGYDEATHFAHVYVRLEDRLIVLQRRVASLSRSFHRALHDLTRLQSLRAKRPSTPPPAAPSIEIGFVPQTLPTSAPPAESSPTPRNLPHPKPLQNPSIVAKHDNNTRITFGPLRAYTLPELMIRKGTL
jgi:hypothetical protein